MARFIHTADWQIGMPFLFLNEEARFSMRNSRFDMIDSIADYIADQNGEIDFVLVAGDLFDDPRIGRDTIEKSLTAVKRINCPVYILVGNHEWRGTDCIYHSKTFMDLKPSNVVVLEPGVLEVAPGVEIVAAPFEGKNNDSDLIAEQLNNLSSNASVRIVVGHGAVDEFMDIGKSDVIRYSEIKKAIDAGLVDYVALGDRHSALDVGGIGRVFYSGAPEPTDYDEDQNEVGLILDVIVEKNSLPIVKKQKIAKWKLDRLGKSSELYSIHSASDLDDLERFVESMRKPRTTALKIYMDSYLDVEQEIRRTELFDRWNGISLAGFVVAEHSNEPQLNTEDVDTSDSLGLSGYLKGAYEELIASAAEEESETVIKALAILSRLAKTQ
jgi:DNA repair exonuclease SbcCD nuclease subunit